MVESVLLVKAKAGIEEKPRTLYRWRMPSNSLADRFGASGAILHVAANSEADLQKAMLDFSKRVRSVERDRPCRYEMTEPGSTPVGQRKSESCTDFVDWRTRFRLKT